MKPPIALHPVFPRPAVLFLGAALGIASTILVPLRAQVPEGPQQAKPITTGTAATRTTMEALSSAITGSFLGGLSMFRIQLGESGWIFERSMAASNGDSSWSIWATPVYSSVNNRIEPLLTEGSVTLLLAGVEYTLDDASIVGVSFTRDWARITSIERVAPNPDRRSAVRGLGYTIAPYFARQLGTDWLLDLSIGAGVNDLTSVQSNASVAKPKDDRSFASIGLTYLKPFAKRAVFTGKIGASVTRDAIDDFNSVLPSGAATPVEGSDARLKQFRAGGQVSYQMGSFSPYIGAYALANDFTVVPDAPIKPREYAQVVQLVAGVNASTGPVYGALALLRERDRNQARVYLGLRF